MFSSIWLYLHEHFADWCRTFGPVSGCVATLIVAWMTRGIQKQTKNIAKANFELNFFDKKLEAYQDWSEIITKIKSWNHDYHRTYPFLAIDACQGKSLEF